LKVFIGTQEIAGYYSNLNKGFDKCGVNSNQMDFFGHSFGYLNTSDNILLKSIKWSIAVQANNSQNKLFKLFRIVEIISRWLMLFFLMLTYDVFIFGYGQSILRWNRDLKYLKFFNKKIIFNVGHGSEIRMPALDGAIQSKDGKTLPTTKELNRLSIVRKKRMRIIERYADEIIGAPYSSSLFATKPFINWFHIGIPFDSTKVNEGVTNQMEGRVRILHSPSHPAVKGTFQIRKEIQKLKNQGLDFDYVEIINKPNSEVIDEIKKCSFVIDQIYSDVPMAGLATEAAWFGKPSIVSGYGFMNIVELCKIKLLPPTELCLPDNVSEHIKKLIADPEYRIELGASAQKFVKGHWSAQKVAERYWKIITNDIPQDWYFDPMTIRYIEGIGYTKEQVIVNCKNQINDYGFKSLQIDHREDIKDLIKMKIFESKAK
jgi:hypothetical protein